MTKQYRNHKWSMQDLEPHFSKHMEAMTVEDLHSKADIAIELAVRDKKIEMALDFLESEKLFLRQITRHNDEKRKILEQLIHD